MLVYPVRAASPHCLFSGTDLLIRLYSVAGCLVQVLDLGITRMMCHRLILIFPHVCKAFYPEYKDESAPARAGNVRTEFLGRRSLAPFISPGYVCSPLLSLILAFFSWLEPLVTQYSQFSSSAPL